MKIISLFSGAGGLDLGFKRQVDDMHHFIHKLLKWNW